MGKFIYGLLFAASMTPVAMVPFAYAQDSKLNDANSAEKITPKQPTQAPVKAKSVPLDQPIVEKAIDPPFVKTEPSEEPETATKKSLTQTEPSGPQLFEKQRSETLSGDAKALPNNDAAETKPPTKTAVKLKEKTKPPLLILNKQVPAGTTTRLSWSPSQSLDGLAIPTPVLIVNGEQDGPTLCLTGAIHGDELNGIEMIRRVMYNLDPNELSGTVIGVPIVNLQGFQRSSRYLTDRRDLNRYFPGSPTGSSAGRIAYSFFHEVITHCDALVDIHTASFHRTNMPQLRANLTNAKVRKLTQGFGSTVVIQSEGTQGTLRRAAVAQNIPAVTLEVGESLRLQEEAVQHGVDGIETLMSKLGMVDRFRLWGDPEPVYYESLWIRTDHGGILFSQVDVGENVDKGDLLGAVTDPITNVKVEITSPYTGRIIGKAVNQVVLPGFAAFHIAFKTEAADLEEDEDSLLFDVKPAPSPDNQTNSELEE